MPNENGEKIQTFGFGYLWIQTQFPMIRLGLEYLLIPNFQMQLHGSLVSAVSISSRFKAVLHCYKDNPTHQTVCSELPIVGTNGPK